ncbi:hypothetical protein OVY01_11480 [Robbsia sp. Bb-Pol-6]|uniref:Translation initiation factor IF-2 n=1 Tax=Robbsia betulipollinis TaxID=2981849 RepID=A0ABT3ZMV0_9BURK|nr:hypothetical protein [Robbsia betulipollinis]MCY0387844.1 hypothetical protein [Robbsia betulipollinis]
MTTRMRPVTTLLRSGVPALRRTLARLATAGACLALAACVVPPYGGYAGYSGQPAYIETGPAYYAPAPYYGAVEGGAAYYYDAGPRWRGPPPDHGEGPRFGPRGGAQDGRGQPGPGRDGEPGRTQQGGPGQAAQGSQPARSGLATGARPGDGGVRSGGGEGRWNGGSGGHAAPGRAAPTGGARGAGEGG